MQKNTYFKMIFQKAYEETAIKNYLNKVSNILKIEDIEGLSGEYSAFVNSLPLFSHFELICSKIPLNSKRENYFKRLAKLHDTNITAIKADFKDYENKKIWEEEKKKQERLPLLLKELFKLDFKPLIDSCFSDFGGKLSHNDGKSELQLCNLFAPVSKIQSEINGRAKTHLRLKMIYQNQIVEIVESSRDLIKNERLANVFSDYGFIVDSTRANRITKYIADYILSNQETIQHETGRLQTGWTKGIFYIPQRDQKVIWLEPNLTKAYQSYGSIEAQLELIRELAKGKVFVNVLGAFASCLYGLINENSMMNFFIHNGGLTEGGKSLAVKCALSFFGKPSKMGNTWNATINGLETYWEQNYSMPTWVDETELSPNLDHIINSCYAFSDGHGKVRAMVKDGEVAQRETKTFRGICFTTGEKSFAEIQNTAHARVKPRGITRRVLDLNVTDLWNGVDQDKAKNLLDENYGILGIDYIEYLEENFQDIKEEFENQISFFKGLAEGEKRKQLAILKLALEIIYQMEFISGYAYDIQVANLKELARVEAENIEMIKDIKSEFTEKFTEFIFANREHFDFITTWSNSGNIHLKTPFYGKVNLEKNTITVFKNEFKKWCHENNFVCDQVLETLDKNKKLSVSKGREKYRDKMVRFDGTDAKRTVWCYEFEHLFNTEIEIIYENLKEKQEPTSIEDKKIEESPASKEKIQDNSLFDTPKGSSEDPIPF